MSKIFNKYTMAFMIFGMLFMLMPGFILYLLDYTKTGETLMLAYCIPLGILAIAGLVCLSVDFIRAWKDWD